MIGDERISSYPSLAAALAALASDHHITLLTPLGDAVPPFTATRFTFTRGEGGATERGSLVAATDGSGLLRIGTTNIVVRPGGIPVQTNGAGPNEPAPPLATPAPIPFGAPATIPPPKEAVEFFRVMVPEGGPMTWQTVDDDMKRDSPSLLGQWHGTLANFAGVLTQRNDAGAGVYWMVSAGDGNGRKKGNVIRIRALFVDLDGTPLESVDTRALPPDVLVESSPGKYHLYWRVADCPLDQFTPLQKALAAKFNGDIKIQDRNRVMRVPGFKHQKGHPFVTRIVESREGPQHTVAAVIAAFGLAPALTTKAPPRVPTAPSTTSSGATYADMDAAQAGVGLTFTVVDATPDVWHSVTDDNGTNASYILQADGSGVVKNWKLGQHAFFGPNAGGAVAVTKSSATSAHKSRADKISANRAFLAACVTADPQHPYAVRKKIAVTGWAMTPDGSELIVPFYNGVDDAPITYQRIMANGDKRSESPMRGTFAMLGPMPKDGDVVFYIASPGTAQTVAEYGGCTVVYAAGDDNLLAAVQASRTMFISKGFSVISVILADDDWHGDLTKVGNNAGIDKARAVADAVGGSFGWPDFPPGCVPRTKAHTDFNDLVEIHGAEEVRKQLTVLVARGRTQAASAATAAEKSADGAYGEDRVTQPFANETEARQVLVQEFSYVASLGGFWSEKGRRVLTKDRFNDLHNHRMPMQTSGRMRAAPLVLGYAPAVFDTMENHPGMGRAFITDQSERARNSYRRSAVLPVENAVYWAMFRDHVAMLYDGSALLTDHFISWLAYHVQFPGEKIVWAPLHINEHEGTGRGWLVEVIRQVLGASNVFTIDSDRLEGRFNLGMAFAQLLYAAELYLVGTRGDKAAVWNKVKPIISDRTLNIEPKGVNSYEIPNRTNCFFTSQHEDAAAITGHDRRLWVHQSAAAPQPDSYFGMLYALTNPDPKKGQARTKFVNAVLHGLQAWKMAATFSPGGRAMGSASKASVVIAGDTPLTQLLRELRDAGAAPFAYDLVSVTGIADWWTRERHREVSIRDVSLSLRRIGAVPVNRGEGLRLSRVDAGRYTEKDKPRLWAVREVGPSGVPYADMTEKELATAWIRQLEDALKGRC